MENKQTNKWPHLKEGCLYRVLKPFLYLKAETADDIGPHSGLPTRFEGFYPQNRILFLVKFAFNPIGRVVAIFLTSEQQLIRAHFNDMVETAQVLEEIKQELENTMDNENNQKPQYNEFGFIPEKDPEEPSVVFLGDSDEKYTLNNLQIKKDLKMNGNGIQFVIKKVDNGFVVKATSSQPLSFGYPKELVFTKFEDLVQQLAVDFGECQSTHTWRPPCNCDSREKINPVDDVSIYNPSCSSCHVSTDPGATLLQEPGSEKKTEKDD